MRQYTNQAGAEFIIGADREAARQWRPVVAYLVKGMTVPVDVRETVTNEAAAIMAAITLSEQLGA